MALERIECESREAWLALRDRQGIGGSEAAAAVGKSPWQTPLELWRLKTGQAVQKDLSGNAAVEQGNRLEPGLRAMFAADHPKLVVEYHQFDLLFQSERPWLFATLDGELTHSETGRRGILEIKTATPGGRPGWDKWMGQVPQNYFIQICHQMLATGYDFAVLYAGLRHQNGDITLREYEFERSEVAESAAWLLEQETRFYEEHIRKGVMPSMPLSL